MCYFNYLTSGVLKRKVLTKECVTILVISDSLGKMNCIDWLYYKANILIISPFVLQEIS